MPENDIETAKIEPMRKSKRAPRGFKFGNQALVGNDARLARDVQRQAKKHGLGLCVEIEEVRYDGVLIERSVTASPVPHPRLPKAARALCGARTRKGAPCRMHGGLSTGPVSEAGRAAISESNRRRAENRVLEMLSGTG